VLRRSKTRFALLQNSNKQTKRSNRRKKLKEAIKNQSHYSLEEAITDIALLQKSNKQQRDAIRKKAKRI